MARITFFALIGALPSGDLDGMHSCLSRAGQLAVAAHGFDLVFLHQKLKALGMFRNDFRLAVLNCRPVQRARVNALDPKLFGVLQVVPKLGVEQQRFGRNAAHVQTGAAEEAVFLDRRLQAVLTRADGGSVSRGAAADDGDVVNGFRQGDRPEL